MPLYPSAERLIRGNFAIIKRGGKPRPVTIGYLTDAQLNAINANRLGRNFSAIDKEILFVGTHVYESRIIRDGYTEEDLLIQITSAMSEQCLFAPTIKMTALINLVKRDSGYGCLVNDEATLECSSKFPKAELYSVIPRGDQKCKPARQREAALEASLIEEEVTNSPG